MTLDALIEKPKAKLNWVQFNSIGINFIATSNWKPSFKQEKRVFKFEPDLPLNELRVKWEKQC